MTVFSVIRCELSSMDLFSNIRIYLYPCIFLIFEYLYILFYISKHHLSKFKVFKYCTLLELFLSGHLDFECVICGFQICIKRLQYTI